MDGKPLTALLLVLLTVTAVASAPRMRRALDFDQILKDWLKPPPVKPAVTTTEEDAAAVDKEKPTTEFPLLPDDSFNGNSGLMCPPQFMYIADAGSDSYPPQNRNPCFMLNLESKNDLCHRDNHYYLKDGVVQHANDCCPHLIPESDCNVSCEGAKCEAYTGEGNEPPVCVVNRCSQFGKCRLQFYALDGRLEVTPFC